MNEATDAFDKQQAKEIFITASSHHERTKHKRDGSELELTQMLAEQIVASVRKNIENRLDNTPLNIGTVVIANQLYFDRSREKSAVNKQLGITGEETIHSNKVKRIKLFLDKTEQFSPSKLNQIAWRVRERVLELIENDDVIPEETKQSLRTAKFLITRVKSNAQPAMDEARKHVQKGNAVIFAGGEVMDGFKDPGKSLADTVIPESLYSKEETNTMSKVIEGMILHLFENLGIDKEFLTKYMDHAAAYSRLMAFKNGKAFNPKNDEKQWCDPDKTDQENFNNILGKIQNDDKYISDVKLFKVSHCCTNTSAAGAMVIEDEQTTEHALKIKGIHTEINEKTIEERYAGLTDNGEKIVSEDTVKKAWKHLLGKSELTENDIPQDMIVSIHNAFSILVALFLEPLGKIEGNDIKEQMDNFTKLSVKELQEKNICLMGELFGGHPSSATAITMIDQYFDYCKESGEEEAKKKFILIASVWGPFEAVSLMLLEYCRKSKQASPQAKPSNQQQVHDPVP